MTVNISENKTETVLPQDKVETNLDSQKVELKKEQSKPENNSKSEIGDDPNWKAFREARKKDRAEREAAEKRAQEKEAEAAALRAAMEAAFSKQPIPVPNNQYSDHYSQEETEEEKIDKRVNAAIAAREAQAAKERLERERIEYPQRLSQTYPDFNYIISQDNLDYLDYHFPEVSRPLQRLPDGFDKWSDIYHAIKKFIPNNKESKKDAVKADANAMKPKSISSMGITQPGEGRAIPNMIDIEAKRAARYAEMKRIINGIG
jgi:hypothetical protein